MEEINLIIGTCPKPFISPIDQIQLNAINSWKCMAKSLNGIKTHIIVFGDEVGLIDTLSGSGVLHVPNIKRNEWGTPLVDDIFRNLKEISSEMSRTTGARSVCMFIHTDIILLPEFGVRLTSALKYTRSIRDYLLIGVRWDIKEPLGSIDVKSDEWWIDVKNKALSESVANDGHGCSGIDYFIFSPTTYQYIYPFAIGKFVWDQWLVGNCFRRDVWTCDIGGGEPFAIHQCEKWYQNGEFTSNKKKMFESMEVDINHSFDYYTKNIYSGTRWKIIKTPKGYVFEKKMDIPDED